MAEDNEYYKQLKRLRSSILFTIDKVPEKNEDNKVYLKDVLENVILMMGRAR